MGRKLRFGTSDNVGSVADRSSLAMANVVVAPCSTYLSESAGLKWEHSIPQMDVLRYSITCRNVRED